MIIELGLWLSQPRQINDLSTGRSFGEGQDFGTLLLDARWISRVGHCWLILGSAAERLCCGVGHRRPGAASRELNQQKEPTWNGYLLTVVCSCGVVFQRWVTPEDAELELIRLARLN